jgi:hypothetical protein
MSSGALAPGAPGAGVYKHAYTSAELDEIARRAEMVPPEQIVPPPGATHDFATVRSRTGIIPPSSSSLASSLSSSSSSSSAASSSFATNSAGAARVSPMQSLFNGRSSATNGAVTARVAPLQVPSSLDSVAPSISSHVTGADADTAQRNSTGAPPVTGTVAGRDDEGICRQAAAAKAMFMIEIRNCRPSEKGVDKRNRDGIGLNGGDCHSLATKIINNGCVLSEFAQCIAVQIAPGDTTEKEFNRRLCNDNPLLPSLTAETAELMTLTTIVRSHSNMVNRCYWFGVKCGHPEHTLNGEMNMAFLDLKDPDWANALRAGTSTVILSHKIRERPEMMDAICIADNVINANNLIEHSVQLIARMTQISRKHLQDATVNAVVARARTLREFQRKRSASVAQSDEDADDFLNFAMRVVNCQSILQELESFRSRFMADGNRELAASFIGQTASLHLNMNHLRVAFLKAQLTCHGKYLKGKICSFLASGDIQNLMPGKTGFNDALRAEEMLSTARRIWATALDSLSEQTRTQVLVKLDCMVVRCLVKKETKHTSLEECMVAAHESLVTACTEAFPTEPVAIDCPWTVDATSTKDVKAPKKKKEKEDDASCMNPTQFDASGRALMDCVLRDAGFEVNKWVDVIDVTSLPAGFTKGSKWQITKITSDAVELQTFLGAKLGVGLLRA